MRRLSLIPVSFFVLLLIFGCSQSSPNSGNSESTAEATTDELKDVNDLTYQDVVSLVFQDDGEGVEWHGEALPNDLKEFLIIEEGPPCGENDCGKSVTIRNTSDKTIVVITRGDFDINAEQGYLARKYIIVAGETLSMGCSHLCYQGESFSFVRAVVGSESLD